MARLRSNPKLPEGINRSDEHPLKEFAWLLAGVSLALVGAVVILSLLVGWLAPAIPFRWELALTDRYEQSLSGAANESRTSQLEAAEQAVKDLGASLVATQQAEAALLPEDQDIRYHFHLLSESTPNAFATLGGHIFVTTGLLRQVHSENALAMVMAHEMAHITQRHPVQALSRGALFQLLLLMVTGGQGMHGVSGVLGQAGLLTVLSFNREMERDADREAIDLLLARYGHLQGADEFFQKMLALQGDTGWAQWAQTHPGVGERLSAIERRNPVGTGEKPQLTPLDARLVRWQEADAIDSEATGHRENAASQLPLL
ncbi:M48 family metallopeptidase [Aestuariicella sp. G3-2]|uniref:M48 family metallopeptidase n=1 Tax=Pseudomaricurvus albidus TaxID=2842452 RepID=UPI001C0E3DEF|nr:M48 family metallopeptidase [Aestuariicella albida]MBU3069617.1 M48 family metallopeptidase [Aestuariicella albida]